MTALAPIALFVYNRPLHTRRTVDALKKNAESAESELIIFSDAPKSEIQASAVDEVRQYIRKIDGFKSVTIIERDSNYGLARSIIDGVTSVVNKYGRIIVLEDDLITSPYFLEYMNSALDKYSQDERVMQISGYMFPVKIYTNEDSLFLALTTSWGWATWQRAWQHFDPLARGYEQLKHDCTKKRNFDLGDSYPYSRMLESQLSGEIDSWAIRWWLSVHLHNGIVLYPRQSLVENIGFDGSGTHCGRGGYAHKNGKWEHKIKFPEEVAISVSNHEVLIQFMKNNNPEKMARWTKRIANRLASWAAWLHK